MSGFDLARANELAAENPKVDAALLNRLDAALSALDAAGVTGTPSYGITSPYEWRRLEATKRDKLELPD